jgi:hypothetical protein
MAMSEINSMPPKVMGDKLTNLLNLLMDYPRLLDMKNPPKSWERVKLETCKKMIFFGMEWMTTQKGEMHKTTN